jgi:phage baseplate assembly protein W
LSGASFFRRKNIVVPTEQKVDTRFAKPIGVTIPFNNPNGVFFQSYTNRNQVYSNLKNLLLTAKGERYMLPEFGTQLRLILFENISSEEEFQTSLKNEITDAIGTWMPFLLIEELDVNINMGEDGRVDDPSHAVGITLKVYVSGTNIYLPIQIFISDTGNLTIEEAVYNG